MWRWTTRPGSRPFATALREQVQDPDALGRALAGQYVAGGLLALAWAVPGWYSAPAGRSVIAGLGVLAVALGAVMGWLTTRLSGRGIAVACHACIASAQVVICVGHAATQDPQSPLLYLLLWTATYAAVLPRSARWLHVASSSVALVLASLALPPSSVVVAELVFVLATLVTITYLVSRVTERLNRAATHDALTGLPNRRLLRAATRAALARRGEADAVVVLLLDLDRFKHINDNYGHAVGDVVLAELARRIRERLRADDVVARLGGDEFAVLRVECGGPPDLEALLGRLAAAWSEPVLVGDRRLWVDGCVGVAVATADDTPETLLRDADIAMYEAKAAGGSRWRVFDPDASGRSGRMLAIESGLREAAARGELALHYQPVVALGASRALGAEALLRWTSGELGPVGPDEFIVVAEKCGLIDGLGSWALDRALADLAAWRDAGVVDPTFQVAVNVSAYQLVETFPDEVAGLLARYRLPATSLALEVTETAMMTGETPGAVLGRLHADGVLLMLDDFGTGHSSLAHLRRFPVDVVKVDRSFVGGMCDDPDDRALVHGVLSLAHALGRTVVAEGIETREQLDALTAAGCAAGQGFGLSRPVPADALPDAVRRAVAAATGTRHPSGASSAPAAVPMDVG